MKPRTVNENKLPTSCENFKALEKSIREGGQDELLKEKEKAVRKKSHHSTFWLLLINAYSSFLVFLFHLISLESIASIILSVFFTVATYLQVDGSDTFDGSIMDWTLISFAVISPMSSSIGMAFSRREQALKHISAVRATLFGLYSAHASWDWKGKDSKTGRELSNVDWCAHSDRVLNEILHISDLLCRVLTLSAKRARHRITRYGREEAAEVTEISDMLYDQILLHLGRITLACEILKQEGLPPNEATRLRQWERIVVENIEGLRMIKSYRTPQALRSFCRLFSVFLPPFYAPFYAQMATDLMSLGAAVAYSVWTSLALTALFESLVQLEDPFVAHLALDGIDVRTEFSLIQHHQLVSQRDNVFFPNAKPFQSDKAEEIRNHEEFYDALDGSNTEQPRIFSDGR